VLNVLTSIDESSLKEGDLATLGEKLATQQTLMSIQRAKRDVVDTDSSLKVLAAWESVGLSQKGDKAGDFLNRTVQGLGETGSDNMMLLKYEAAKRAHPELATDPAALRRFVRFNSDDPMYQQQFFKFANEITGNNPMAMDQLMYSAFDPQSEYDMQMYERAMKDGDWSNIMTGKQGIQKGRKGTLSQAYADTEAQGMKGGLDQLVAGFKEIVGDLAIMFEDTITGNTLDVNVVSTKYGNLGVSKTTKGVRPKK
jgi:hypothetical protein